MFLTLRNAWQDILEPEGTRVSADSAALCLPGRAPDWRGFHPLWFHFPFFIFPLGAFCKVTPTSRGCLEILDTYFWDGRTY